MEDNKEMKDKINTTDEETKEGTKETQETTEKEEKQNKDKEEEKKEDKEKNKDDKKELNEFEDLKRRLEILEEDNKKKEEALKEQTIKNTVMEKIDNKDLQKAVLETGLVKDISDIEKVIKIVELSKTLNKSKFTDGWIPKDEAKADAYEQAEKKGDIFSMIKQKMNKH